MENATEALKLVLGIMIFIIAFTVLFQTASLARYTSELIITERDKTTYYSYYDKNDSAIVENDGLVNRKVTLEEIIPTIYRYSDESYGVTIIDFEKQEPGHIIARFDIETEELCSSWYQNNPNDKGRKQKLTDHINNYVLKPIGLTGNNLIYREDPEAENKNSLKRLFSSIYMQVPNNFYQDEFNCAWTRDEKSISQRIDSDLSRNTSNI